MKPVYDFEDRYYCTAADAAAGYVRRLIAFGHEADLELIQLHGYNNSRGFCLTQLGFSNKWNGVAQGSMKILRSGYPSQLGAEISWSGPLNAKADGLVLYVRPVLELDLIIFNGEYREL